MEMKEGSGGEAQIYRSVQGPEIDKATRVGTILKMVGETGGMGVPKSCRSLTSNTKNTKNSPTKTDLIQGLREKINHVVRGEQRRWSVGK